MLWANRAKRIASRAILFNLQTEGSGSDSASDHLTNLNIRYHLDPQGNNIYGVLVAAAAYTPGSGDIFWVELTVEQA